MQWDYTLNSQLLCFCFTIVRSQARWLKHFRDGRLRLGTKFYHKTNVVKCLGTWEKTESWISLSENNDILQWSLLMTSLSDSMECRMEWSNRSCHAPLMVKWLLPWSSHRKPIVSPSAFCLLCPHFTFYVFKSPIFGKALTTALFTYFVYLCFI